MQERERERQRERERKSDQNVYLKYIIKHKKKTKPRKFNIHSVNSVTVLYYRSFDYVFHKLDFMNVPILLCAYANVHFVFIRSLFFLLF